MKQQDVPGLAAAAVVAVALGYLIKRRRTDRLPLDNAADNDLIGLVGWTSRMCAAARALETRQPDALYQDPLAETLAGTEAFAFLRRTSQAVPPQEDFAHQTAIMGTAPDDDGNGEHRLGRFHIRVKYFDDQLLRFTGPNPGAPAKTAQQVVLLGAGMDTRAWRLKLPPGIKWFELDVPGVLDVKQRLLARVGAELPAAQGSRRPAGRRRQHRFPLRVASYTPVVADLGDPGWTAELQKAGWDPSAPTVFLAEGLTRYLEPDVLKTMFHSAAKDSAPGSTFIATMSSEAEVAEWRSQPHTLGGANASSHWGYPEDPDQMKALFEGLGWFRTGFETASSCARAVVGLSHKLSFDETSGGADDAYLFWIAHNERQH